jgi:hypothetical protein
MRSTRDPRGTVCGACRGGAHHTVWTNGSETTELPPCRATNLALADPRWHQPPTMSTSLGELSGTSFIRSRFRSAAAFCSFARVERSAARATLTMASGAAPWGNHSHSSKGNPSALGARANAGACAHAQRSRPGEMLRRVPALATACASTQRRKPQRELR